MGRLLFFLLIFLPNYLFAITVTWDGGGDEISWSDPINWSSNVVPCATCDVIIETDSVVLSNNVSIKSLILGGSGKSSALYVTEDSEFTLQSALENGIKLVNGSRLYLEGLISINNPLTNGVFVSNGYLYAIGKSELIINSAGELGMTTGINGKVYMGLINGHNPTFNIDNSSESGLVNLGIFEVNYGELNITNSDDNGLRNIAQFTNYASVFIDNSDLASILNNTLNGHFIHKRASVFCQVKLFY
jgi:hypothetical protein